MLPKGIEMRETFLICALLFSASANAQIYKCIKDRKTTVQGTPCDRKSNASRAIGGYASVGSAWPWEGLKYGMSLDEVQRNVPGTTQVMGSHLYDGAKELLKKTGVTVAGITFEASYFFKDGRLSQVNVNDRTMNKNEVTLPNFERLLSELRARFGNEREKNVKNESWGISGEASWSVGGDKLWVSITPITADTSTLNFGYNLAR